MKRISLEIGRLVIRGKGLSTTGPGFARLLERKIRSVLSAQDSLSGIEGVEASRRAAPKISVNRGMSQEKFAQSIAKSVCNSVAGKKGRHD